MAKLRGDVRCFFCEVTAATQKQWAKRRAGPKDKRGIRTVVWLCRPCDLKWQADRLNDA